MAKDYALHLEGYLPAANATNTVGALDLGVDTSGFSDQWRLGRLRVTIPALPNNTNANCTVTLTLQDSTDGSNFSNTSPLIQAQVLGVATNGSPAAVIDMPLPPGLRGPIQILQAVAANGGTNTAALITYDWVNE